MIRINYQVHLIREGGKEINMEKTIFIPSKKVQ
jgi:hypothetical protein